MTKRAIAGSRALITGASGGIGRAIALELARLGADLVLLARRAEKLQRVADEIHTLGRRAELVVGDVTDATTRSAAVDRAAALGGLDILVNNAGVGALGPFEQASPERLRRIMEVNFFALTEMTRAALPLLKRGRQPLIINIGSILGHRGVPQSSEYCASKFAVEGFSQSLRAELAPQGIDVLVVSPASTDSEFFDHLIDQQGSIAFRSRRPASPEHVARQVVRAIRHGQPALFPTWSAQFVHWLQRLSPGVMNRIVRQKGRQD
jgi:short-subunit dehydrogenase